MVRSTIALYLKLLVAGASFLGAAGRSMKHCVLRPSVVRYLLDLCVEWGLGVIV